MEVARWPFGPKGLEANCANVVVAVLLPEGPTVRMTVQGLSQLDHRLLLTFEGSTKLRIIRPSLGWQVHPARSAFEVSLNIGSWGIRNLRGMAQHSAKGIACASSLQSGWAAAQILEKCYFPALVNHPITLENGAALILTIWVPLTVNVGKL